MLMECNQCGHIQEAKLQTIHTVTGLEHVYLQCERCYVKTTSYVTDKKLRRTIAENKQLREKTDFNDEDVRKLSDTDLYIKERMDKLTEENKF